MLIDSLSLSTEVKFSVLLTTAVSSLCCGHLMQSGTLSGTCMFMNHQMIILDYVMKMVFEFLYMT